MTLLKPWFVAKSFWAIATYPIGARDENKTDPLGINRAEEFFNPSLVNPFLPIRMYFSL